MAKLWYCVMTKHNQENVAQENLERQNFWTLFPKYLATTNEYTGQQLKQPILKHAFPGYGFVCFDVEADPWRKIWSTHGVKQLMSWSPASPARVPTRIIRELRGIYSPAHDYKSGQLLKIVRGKHAGEIGFVQWADEERVQLLMTILDRKTQVQSLMTFSRQNVTPTKWKAA